MLLSGISLLWLGSRSQAFLTSPKTLPTSDVQAVLLSLGHTVSFLPCSGSLPATFLFVLSSVPPAQSSQDSLFLGHLLGFASMVSGHENHHHHQEAEQESCNHAHNDH